MTSEASQRGQQVSVGDEAVQAAAWEIYKDLFAGHAASQLDQVGRPIRDACLRKARAALEAAAPHMLAEAWEEGRLVGRAEEQSGFDTEMNPYAV